MTTKTIGMIVGTGLWQELSSLNLTNKKTYKNTQVSFGSRKGKILYHEIGFCNSLRVVILPRHGIHNTRPQRSPAELILSFAHEAHIWFLHELGVDEVYGFNTVGALDSTIPLANTNTFVVPDQFSYGFGCPVHSFGESAKYPHPEMNEIFAKNLRENLCRAIISAGNKVIQEGTYIYSNPDHLETKVEGKALKTLFGHAHCPVVGSTAGAELVLCKELGMKYALICGVSNFVQGVLNKRVDHVNILNVMKHASKAMRPIVENLFISINEFSTLRAL